MRQTSILSPLRRQAAAVAVASVALALLAAGPSRAAVSYALPGAPTAVTATSVAGGVVVSWKAPADGNAPISAYSVTGGPGTCAVVVDGNTLSTFVPAVRGQSAAVYKVIATNSLGNSEPGAAAAAVAPGASASLRVVGSAGGIRTFGNGVALTTGRHRVIAAASTGTGTGAWLVDGLGRVRSLGTAAVIPASLVGTVAIVPAIDDAGFTLVTRKGVVLSFGTPRINATLPKGAAVVAAARGAQSSLTVIRANGAMYSVTASGVTALPALPAGAAVIAATSTVDGKGGWALRANGEVVAFGSAPAITGTVDGGVSLWRTPSGKGVWVLKADSSVAGLGDAVALPNSGIVGPFALIAADSEPNIASVTIDEFSDFHGQIEANSTGIGGAAALKAWFDADKAKGSTIIASGGDNFGAAPPVSSQFEEIPTVLSENQMGLDVTTLGNHEHDQALAHLQKMINTSNFKWVASNYATFDSLQGIAPYVIIERGGVKVAFVGANNQETSQVATKTALGSISFLDPVTSINKAIIDARAAGAQVVVALTHYGFAENVAEKATGPLLDIAAGIKGADLIFGAHSHLKYAGRINGTLVAQTTNAGALYARNTVCLDLNSGRVIGTAGDFVSPTVKAVTPDASLTALVKNYADQIATKFDTRLGTVNGVFPFGGSPAVQRQGEVAIGDFIADIVRAKYATDVVIINGGGIRANLPALSYKPKDTALVRPTLATSTGTFDLLLGDVFTVLPFGNQLATTSVTGAQIWSAMENGVSQFEAVAGRFPQISGFKFTFDVKKPVGSRVQSVVLRDGTPIANDASKTYTLTTLDYMISGGDGYTQFNPSKAIIRDLYAQVVADAIVANPNVVIPALDGRITKL